MWTVSSDVFLQQEARRSALYIAVMALIGSVLMMLLLRSGSGPAYPIWSWALLFCVAAAATLITQTSSQLPKGASLALLSLLFSTHELALWVLYQGWANHGERFAPFSGQKLAVLIIALILPSLWVGAALILLAMLLALTQYMSWPLDVRALVPPNEPWVTVIFGIAALAVLRASRKRSAVMHQVANARIERTWLERVARLALSVQDLANTPLQTLKITSGLLRYEQPGSARVAETLDGAVDRLARLNQLLTPLNRYVAKGAVLSFDALSSIKEELSAKRPEGGGPSSIQPPDRDREARDATRWFAWVCTGVGVLGAASAPSWIWIVAAVVGISCAVVTHVVPTLPRGAWLALFALESLTVLAAAWISAAAQVASGRPFVPFVIVKILMLLMVLAPSGPLGGAFIALAMIEALVQSFTWPAEVRVQLFRLEPMATLIVGAYSLPVLVLRRRHISQLSKAVQEQAEADLLRRLLQLSLLVRDLSRAPLDTLRSVSLRLRDGPAAEAKLAHRVESAVVRLDDLNEALSPVAVPILEGVARERSTDGLSVVEAEVRKLLSDRPVPARR
jgi:hypothetical protein